MASLFFLVLGMLAVIRNYLIDDNISFFWYCDFAPFLLSFAFFYRNDQLIKSLINIGLIAQLLSFISLFLLFFGIPIGTFSDNLSYGTFYFIVTLLLHVFSLNVALFLTYKIP